MPHTRSPPPRSTALRQSSPRTPAPHRAAPAVDPATAAPAAPSASPSTQVAFPYNTSVLRCCDDQLNSPSPPRSGSRAGCRNGMTRPMAGGPVTLLFTDLVSSTELLQRVGDEQAQRVFRVHHRLLGDAVTGHGGHEVQWLGGGLMSTFAASADE